ncbi:MAG TPA: BTAD domain-containing putative transcriptional regulator [Herpetosiphonaceae bacterium]
MSRAYVRLLGTCTIQFDDCPPHDLGAGKLQELFCYLLFHREQPHARETLAGMLWADSTSAQSKKYLRQALWQLQSSLDQYATTSARLLLVDSASVQLNPGADLWLDVTEFEQACLLVQGIQASHITPARFAQLQKALDLYCGDLLPGWYQEWCLYERERLINMYLMLLDKLMLYCEANHEYDTGLVYGTRILGYDRARECTHRRMMRLYYLAGDRTGALHQFNHCVATLSAEFDAKPAQSTLDLYRQIHDDSFVGQSTRRAPATKQATALKSTYAIFQDQLSQIYDVVTALQHQVLKHMQTLEALDQQRSSDIE